MEHLVSRFSIGQHVEVTVHSLSEDGAGVGSLDQDTHVTIAGSLVGEVVRARLVARSRHTGNWWAEVAAVLTASGDRTPVACAQFERGRCSGCSLLHMSAQQEWSLKQRRVATALGIECSALVAPTNALPEWGYRNRSWYVVGVERGQPRLGSFLQRSHRLGNMNGCLVVAPEIERTRGAIHRLLSELNVLCCENGGKLSSVPALTDPPALRYVQLRSGDGGAVLVEYVFTTPVRDVHPLFEATHALPDVVSVHVSHNPDTGNRLAAHDARLISGDPTVTITVGGRAWRVGPRTFFQLNTRVADTIARQCSVWAQGARTIWDLYSGLGVMSVGARERGVSVYSADVVPESERLAAGLSGTEHVTLDLATEPLPEHWPSPDLIIVNPPRRGLDDRVVETLLIQRPGRVVYVSCNPATLSSDLQRLTGYRVEQAGAWNMLPQTAHVESAVLLVTDPR